MNHKWIHTYIRKHIFNKKKANNAGSSMQEKAMSLCMLCDRLHMWRYICTCTYTYIHTYVHLYMRKGRPGHRSRYSDSIRAGRSGNWIPLGDEIFRTRPDWPWGPPRLLYSENWVSFPELKRPWRDVDHPPPSSAEVEETVELYLYSPSTFYLLYMW
jgi:hypothetical protein